MSTGQPCAPAAWICYVRTVSAPASLLLFARDAYFDPITSTHTRVMNKAGSPARRVSCDEWVRFQLFARSNSRAMRK
jgi:hypothetical protein